MADENIKIGAAINRSNKERLSDVRAHTQAIVEHVDAMIPVIDVPDEEKSVDLENTVISYGGQIKAVDVEGGVLIKAPLVIFSNPDDPDLDGEYFDKDTDFDMEFPGKSTTYFNHGLDEHFKLKRLQPATLTMDDFAIWAESILHETDEYENFLIQLGRKGKLGMSSGVPGHLVEKETVGKAVHIKYWPLGKDASYTHTPAEPRTRQVIPLKSLSVNFAESNTVEATETAPESETATTSTKSNKEIEMEKSEIEQIVADAVRATKDEVLAAMKAAPAPDNSGTQPVIEVVLDEADRPFKSIAEQCTAIKNATLTDGRKMDPRLLRVKAILGANEGIPADGGYLLDPTLSNEIIKPMNEAGPFSSRARKLPVSNNSNYGWINGVDETSRVAGSRWGGVLGYRIAEGAAPTASAPKFRRINWELKKYAVLMYATDELLADAAQFNAVAQQSAGEELNFMLNDDILNGLGVGGPLGIMNAGCRVAVARLDASVVAHGDILNMWARLHPNFRKNAAWFIAPGVEAQLNALYFTGTTSVLSPYVSYSPDGVFKVMGKPVIVTEFNPALNAAGDILLADMSQYLLWEKGNAEAAASMHVAFATDQMAFRFIYRVDGQPAYASALTPYKGSSTTSPFVTLGAATA